MIKYVKYKYEHIDMLLAAAIVVQSFKEYIREFSYIRTNWTPEFADSLSQRIATGMKNYLGVEYPDALQKTIKKIMEVMPTTRRYLAFIRWQISEIFTREEADSILNYLGYDLYFDDAEEYDQESLIQLLFSFKSGMNDGLRSLLSGQGINPPLIDRIIEHASMFQKVTRMQKQIKEACTRPPKEAPLEFQQIYREVRLICQTGATFYQDEPAKRELFIFVKIVHSLYIEIPSKEGEQKQEE